MTKLWKDIKKKFSAEEEAQLRMQFTNRHVWRICDYFGESPVRRGAPVEEIDTSQGRSDFVLEMGENGYKWIFSCNRV